MLGEGNLNGKGVYAACDFQAGEVVLHCDWQELSPMEYQNLSESEKQFTHSF